MATKAEVLRLLRFRDNLTTRDVGSILDYVDQEVSAGAGFANPATEDLNMNDFDITSGDVSGVGVASPALSIVTGTPTDGNTGAIVLQSADAVGTNRSTGNVTVKGGTATGTGNGGQVTIEGGRGDTPGRLLLFGGTGGSSGVDGAGVEVIGGLPNGAAVGGNVRLFAGGTSESNHGLTILDGAAGWDLQISGIGSNTRLNPVGGMAHELTILGALTIDLGTITSNDILVEFFVYLVNPGANITWGTMVEWAGGSAPTLTVAGTDILKFTTVDAGVTWQGTVIGLDFS